MTTGMRRRALRISGGLAALAGLGAIIGLTAYQGFVEVGQVMLTAGWGIALITAYRLTPIAASGLAWRAAAGAVAAPPARWVFFWARLLRESINGLLPVAHVGGEVAGVRVLTMHGNRASVASASVLVDITAELLTQILFTFLGLVLLVADGGHGVADWAGIGLLVAVIAVAGFLLAQRFGLLLLIERLLEHLAVRFDWPALGSLANLHDTAMTIYRNRAAVAGASLWHMAGWLLGAGEVWLTLRILGADTGFGEALIIESLGQALCSAAFLVPGAYGIQESGYMLLGMQFGLAPEVALSVSLIKRVRDLVLGVPAMFIWQFIEGRRLLVVSNSRVARDAPKSSVTPSRAP